MFKKNYNYNDFKIPTKHEEYLQLYPVKKMDQLMWRSRARSRTKCTSYSLGAVRGVQ